MKLIFKVIISLVYKILDFFSLVPAFFVTLLGVVLYFTGTFENNPTLTLIFQIILIVTIVHAIVATTKKLLGLDNRKVKKSKGMQIINNQTAQQSQEQTSQTIENNPQQIVVKEEKPRYFKLKQNPDYVMAEYSDRYELFLITAKGLEKVRTDYKA